MCVRETHGCGGPNSRSTARHTHTYLLGHRVVEGILPSSSATALPALVFAQHGAEEGGGGGGDGGGHGCRVCGCSGWGLVDGWGGCMAWIATTQSPTYIPVAALVEAEEAASLGSPESKNRGVSRSSRGRAPLCFVTFDYWCGVGVWISSN